jgi:cellulose synthase/poly-beta-1,6-N-acetylglucosamine synthase-like glycosyltransferase
MSENHLLALFWMSLFLLTYTYFGYPVLIKVLSRLRNRSIVKQDFYPTIAIVMSVHNEELIISTKLENLLALDYPSDKLEIIVVDNGSSDGTAVQVRSVIGQYPHRQILMIETPHSGGKATALNFGVEACSSEFILFCDARQKIARDAVNILSSVFADPQVGAASGELMIESEKGPGLYWRYERAIRQAEGQFDSTIGTTGALYMIRRSLFRTFPPNLILDDVWLPMQIALQGHRILFVSEAKVYDCEVAIDREFQRKTRTLAGNFQLLETLPRLISPFHNRLFWQFFSHKICRLLCPYALFTVLFANAGLLLYSASWFWWACFVTQCAFYGLAAVGARSTANSWRIAKIAHTFIVLNWAAVIGLKRYIMRDFRWTNHNTIQ